MTSNATYRLDHYHWRSFLTFAGPLLVLVLYAFICFAFLARPPVNDVVENAYRGARWLYFVWFVIVIFTLDWSRTGLANIEAAALMHPKLAPKTAVSLLWHTDMKWANVLWWLRAIKLGIKRGFRRRELVDKQRVSTPDYMWVFLCLTTVIVYCALPLSGLTMEIATTFTYSDWQTDIYGPNYNTFNFRSSLPLQQQVRTYWQSGRVTSPLHETILYAPEGSDNVNTTYYDDLIHQGADYVDFFAGPAVRERVSGKAWGIAANISCHAVSKEQFRLLQISDTGFVVKECIMEFGGDGNCSFGTFRDAFQNQVANSTSKLTFPFWVSGSGTSGAGTKYAYIVAADGWPGTSNVTFMFGGLSTNSSHDNMTIDHIENKRPAKDVTTGLFEIYVWEYVGWEDGVMPNLLKNNVSGPVDSIFSMDNNITFAGVAIQCQSTTASGHGQLNAIRRTYSSFQRFWSLSNVARNIMFLGVSNWFKVGTIVDMPASQVLAATALVNGNQPLGDNHMALSDPTTSNDQIWAAFHSAIGLAPKEPVFGAQGWGQQGPGWAWYRSLTPEDLRLAMYKLLGESVIVLMDEGSTDVWEGNLTSLRPTAYLTNGVLSWISVLVLLSIWALTLCLGALWTAFFAGPRWAPTLDGFEMLKFGAQYTEQINQFQTVKSQGCTQALQNIPGMVGMLPGTGGASSSRSQLGFIGLSENFATKGATYTMYRWKAAPGRI